VIHGFCSGSLSQRIRDQQSSSARGSGQLKLIENLGGVLRQGIIVPLEIKSMVDCN